MLETNERSCSRHLSADAMDVIQDDHMIKIAGRSVASCLSYDHTLPELYDLLQGSTSSRDYEFDRGDVLQIKRLVILPDALLSQYQGNECKCFMGLLSEIGRAWMSIDNRLYLWNYQTGRDLTCYDELEDIILDVSLSIPKPNVFLKVIKYVLVIVTSNNIHLMGISFDFEIKDQQGNNRKEKGETETTIMESLDNLVLRKTGLAFSTDQNTFVTIRSLSNGRIFAGSTDGNIYELIYQAEEGWFTKKTHLKNLTCSSLQFLKPSFLTSFSKEESILSIETDEKRHLLYSLGENGTISAYHLGMNNDQFKHIETVANISSHVTQFWPSASLDPDDLRIMDIHPVTYSESAYINLIAYSSGGHRFYFTTLNPLHRQLDRAEHLAKGHQQSESNSTCLELIHIRLAPEEARIKDHRRLTSIWTPKTQKSFYKSGLSVSIGSVDEIQDVVSSHSINPSACVIRQRQWPMERSSELLIEGKVWDLVEITNDDRILYPSTIPDSVKELILGNRAAVRKLLLITNVGIYVLIKSRPIDNLKTILTESNGQIDEFFQEFMDAYTPDQTCFLLLSLACSSKPIIGSLDRENNQWDMISMLEKIGGEPKIIEAGTNINPYDQYGGVREYSPPVTRTRFSSTALHQKDILYSNLHNGCYFYLSRLLHSLWRSPLSQIPKIIDGDLVHQLQDFHRFYKRNLTDFKGRRRYGNSVDIRHPEQARLRELAIQSENESLDSLEVFTQLAIELVSFISICGDYGILFPDRENDYDFETLLTTIKGRRLILELGNTLIQKQLKFHSSIESLCAVLRNRCPHFFSDRDILIYEGMEDLERALETTNSHERQQFLNSSLKHFIKATSSISHTALKNICQKYKSLGFLNGILQISLDSVRTIDPDRLCLAAYYDPSLKLYNPNIEVIVTVDEIYQEVFDAISHCRGLQIDKSKNGDGSGSSGDGAAVAIITSSLDLDNIRNSLVDCIIDSDDELFHYKLYDWLLGQGLSELLLDIKSPFLSKYLLAYVNNNSLIHAELAWKFFQRQSYYDDAAAILIKIAESPDYSISLEKRIEYLALALNNLRLLQSADGSSVVTGGSVGVGSGSRVSDKKATIEDIGERLEVANIQLDIKNRLSTDVDAQQLDRRLFVISELYSFSSTRRLWDICLIIIHSASYNDPALISKLWKDLADKIIGKSIVTTIKDDGWNQRGKAMEDGSRGTIKELESIVIRIGQRVGASTSIAFPLYLILDMLATIAIRNDLECNWTIDTLMSSGANHVELYRQVDKLTDSQIWLRPTNKPFLFEMLLYLIEKYSITIPGNRQDYYKKILQENESLLARLNTLLIKTMKK